MRTAFVEKNEKQLIRQANEQGYDGTLEEEIETMKADQATERADHAKIKKFLTKLGVKFTKKTEAKALETLWYALDNNPKKLFVV